MRFIKQSLSLVIILLLLMGVGLVNADDTGSVSERPSQTDAELTELFYWPEAGIKIAHPEGWQLANDQNFDFVLVGQQDEDGLAYVSMQSGNMGGSTVMDIILSFGTVSEEMITETEFDDVTLYRFDEVGDDNGSILLAYSLDSQSINLLSMTASIELWNAEWQAIYESVFEALTVEPLALDSALLNAQMQANYESTGRVMVGEPDAPVQVYEFLDFACPHCVTYHYSVNRLVQDYAQTGQVNVSFGLLTFVGGELSENTAAAQVCGAALGVGWDVHNLIFENYETMGGAQAGYTVEALLETIGAAELESLDMAEFSACMADEAVLSAFLELSQADATAYGVSGTPAVLFADGDDAFEFITTSNGQTITRTNLYFTYNHLDDLLDTETE